MTFPYSFHTIGSNILHGITQAIKVLIPLIEPDQERSSPPTWWYWYWDWGDWYLNLDADDRPNLDWCYHWTVGSLRLIGGFAEAIGDAAEDAVQSTVRGWVGYIRHGFSDFEHWTENLWNKVGSASFAWASNLSDAANWLRDKFPDAVRYGWQSWQSIWDGIKQSAIDWARARYEDARAWAYGAYAWVLDTGEALKNWYNSSHTWLDDFRQNTHTRVTGLLGDTWRQLVTFAGGSLLFWQNLWGAHAEDIGRFFGNPLLFLYDRVEDFLCSEW